MSGGTFCTGGHPALRHWFDHNVGTFHLQTDASAVGLGAMLEQNGHPVLYASRSLTSLEK